MHTVKRKKRKQMVPNGKKKRITVPCVPASCPQPHSSDHLLSNYTLFLLGFISVYEQSADAIISWFTNLGNIYSSVLEVEDIMLLDFSLYISCIIFHYNVC